MKNTILCTSAILLTLFLIGNAHTQAVPQLINYQGRLTDASGTGLSGTQTLQFNIYDDATAGNLIWGPQTFDNVPLVDGYFNVILGPTDTNGANISTAFDAPDRYVEITHNGNKIAPRQQILSAPFAIKSDYAVNSETVNNDNRFPPIGSIMPWHKNLQNTPDLPDGWVECNGQVLNDPESPYHGGVMPNLNSTNQFLMGDGVSGNLGGNSEHSHQYSGTSDLENPINNPEVINKMQFAFAGKHHNHTYSGVTENASSLPPYMTVVWVIRVK